ncbi:phosphopyruvate hydratase, partial [Acinetobacter baumannii]
ELKSAGYNTGLGDEGGFAPDLPSNREGLDFLIRAIEKAGFTPGQDIAVGLDVAATEFYKDGVYTVEGKAWSVDELVDYFADLVANFPI